MASVYPYDGVHPSHSFSQADDADNVADEALREHAIDIAFESFYDKFMSASCNAPVLSTSQVSSGSSAAPEPLHKGRHILPWSSSSPSAVHQRDCHTSDEFPHMNPYRFATPQAPRRILAWNNNDNTHRLHPSSVPRPAHSHFLRLHNSATTRPPSLTSSEDPFDSTSLPSPSRYCERPTPASEAVGWQETGRKDAASANALKDHRSISVPQKDENSHSLRDINLIETGNPAQQAFWMEQWSTSSRSPFSAPSASHSQLNLSSQHAHYAWRARRSPYGDVFSSDATSTIPNPLPESSTRNKANAHSMRRTGDSSASPVRYSKPRRTSGNIGSSSQRKRGNRKRRKVSGVVSARKRRKRGHNITNRNSIEVIDVPDTSIEQDVEEPYPDVPPVHPETHTLVSRKYGLRANARALGPWPYQIHSSLLATDPGLREALDKQSRGRDTHMRKRSSHAPVTLFPASMRREYSAFMLQLLGKLEIGRRLDVRHLWVLRVRAARQNGDIRRLQCTQSGSSDVPCIAKLPNSTPEEFLPSTELLTKSPPLFLRRNLRAVQNHTKL